MYYESNIAPRQREKLHKVVSARSKASIPVILETFALTETIAMATSPQKSPILEQNLVLLDWFEFQSSKRSPWRRASEIKGCVIGSRE